MIKVDLKDRNWPGSRKWWWEDGAFPLREDRLPETGRLWRVWGKGQYPSVDAVSVWWEVSLADDVGSAGTSAMGPTRTGCSH